MFELLYLNDKDLRGKTLLERKATLKRILPKSPLLLYSEHVAGEGIKAIRAKRANEEGVIAKLASGQYHSGVRTREWLKVKASQEQEVVIVGFTAPRCSRKISARSSSRCVKARVGNMRGGQGPASTPRRCALFTRKLVPLITDAKPVTEKVPDAANTTWVGPKLVAEVKFTERTSAREMRHPVFLGLRTDKPATEVNREKAKPLSEAKPARRARRR